MVRRLPQVRRVRHIRRLAGEPIRNTEAERDRIRRGELLAERIHRLSRDEAGLRRLRDLLERGDSAMAPIGNDELEHEVLRDLVEFLNGEEGA